jgi:beta-galactoside alpha2,6-sialyltransferase (sialyltransferase 2)
MRIPVGLTLQDRSTLEKAKFSKWFIEALPPRDIPRFKTCAVVSSASSLREYRYGKEIDAHDAVFRINNAPVDGYEKMVGQRTTVRVINSQVPFYYNSSKQTVFNDMLEHPPKGLIIFERDELPAAIAKGPRASKATNTSLLWDRSKWNPLTKYTKLRHKFPNLQYYLTHPVFAFFSQWRLLEYVTDHKLGMNEASSGFIAVILATFLCDSVTSYEVATDRVSEPGPYYYSSGQAANYRYWYSWHPLPAERELFKKIGKCRSGTTTCTISIADALC